MTMTNGCVHEFPRVPKVSRRRAQRISDAFTQRRKNFCQAGNNGGKTCPIGLITT
jgi:hypothetical protein